MTNKNLARKRKESLEHAIEDAIIAHPEALNLSGALAIRNFRLAHISGAIDLVLLPRRGRIRLALVETKVALAPDAGCKVVGQLLMYYAGALRLGSRGIETLRQFAQHCPDLAHCTNRTSPQKVVWNVDRIHCHNPVAEERLGRGDRLTPPEIALFVALNDEPRHVLRPLLQQLRKWHGLNIGLVVVPKGRPKLLLRGAGQQIVGRERR